MRNLIDAVKIAHAGKYKTLNVVDHGSFYSYDLPKDRGYLDYCHAMEILLRHKIITAVLRWIKLI